MRDRELEELRQGIVLDDGPCQPARCPSRPKRGLRYLAPAPSRVQHSVEVRIREGRKNQVKRMLGRIHHPVIRLHRVQFGALHLEGLEPGEWRVLDDDEIALLQVQE